MNVIKQAREQHHLSQSELARQIGCSQKHISSLERGETSASPAMAKKLADILSVDVLDILYPESIMAAGRPSEK